MSFHSLPISDKGLTWNQMPHMNSEAIMLPDSFVDSIIPALYKSFTYLLSYLLR